MTCDCLVDEDRELIMGSRGASGEEAVSSVLTDKGSELKELVEADMCSSDGSLMSLVDDEFDPNSFEGNCGTFPHKYFMFVSSVIISSRSRAFQKSTDLGLLGPFQKVERDQIVTDQICSPSHLIFCLVHLWEDSQLTRQHNLCQYTSCVRFHTPLDIIQAAWVTRRFHQTSRLLPDPWKDHCQWLKDGHLVWITMQIINPGSTFIYMYIRRN